MLSNKHLQQMNNYFSGDQQSAVQKENIQDEEERKEEELKQFNEYLKTQKLKNMTPVCEQSKQKQKRQNTQSGMKALEPGSTQKVEEQRSMATSGVKAGKLEGIEKSKVEQSSQMIKSSLKIVFMFYASYGDRQNTSYLKSNKFIKLLTDAGLVPQSFSTKQVDILFKQTTKQFLTLRQFYNLLPKLSQQIYPDLKIQSGLIKMYQAHFEQLFEKIMYYTDFGEQLSFLNNQIGEHFDAIVHPIVKQLQMIYKYIFNSKLHQNQKPQWLYLQFLSQFDLLPALISQSQGQLIFATKQAEDETLSFESFVETLITISFIIAQSQEPDQELKAFKLVLERMEESQGFASFQKQLSRTQNEQMRLVMQINKYVPTQTNTNESMAQQHLTTNQELLQLSNEQANQLDTNITVLKAIFEHYTSLGEPLNLIYLKSFKFKKLLTHAQIIPDLVSQIDVDLIYTKLTGSKWIQTIKNQKISYDANVHSPLLNYKHKLYKSNDDNGESGKMTFNQFLKSLELMSYKCYPDMDINKGVQAIIDNNLVPLEQQLNTEKNEQVLQLLVELLQDEEIVILLFAGAIHNAERVQHLLRALCRQPEQDGPERVHEILAGIRADQQPDLAGAPLAHLQRLVEPQREQTGQPRCDLVAHDSEQQQEQRVLEVPLPGQASVRRGDQHHRSDGLPSRVVEDRTSKEHHVPAGEDE